MSDNIDQANFQVIWDAIKNKNDELELVEVDSAFLGCIPGNEVDQPSLASACPSTKPKEDQLKRQENEKEFQSLSNEDVETFINGQENVNTMKKTHQDILKFRRFLKTKGEEGEIYKIEHELLDQYISNFVLSARKADGKEYEPGSLRGMVSSIDRTLKRHKYPHSIMTNQGPAFSLTRAALKAKQKSLKKQGKGNKPYQSQAITDEELDILYDKGILGGDSPQALLNTIWLNNSIHFGLRGIKENYQLRWGDVSLKTSSDGTEYLELNERQTKTRTGESISDIRKVSPKMFATNDSRNPVGFYKLYAQKRPHAMLDSESPFYVATRTIPIENENDQWFINQRVGEKKLGNLLKNMAINGGLNPDKRLTNHSARKHLVQKLRDAEIPHTDIMQISGHRNVQSITNYSSMSEKQQKACSNILSSRQASSMSTGRRSHGPTCTVSSADTDSLDLPSASSSASGSNFPTHAIDPTQPSNLSMSQITQRQLFQSMFYGATLNIGTLNVYQNQNTST